MKYCDKIDLYGSRSLTTAEQTAFERHLDECQTCSNTISKWRAIESEIRAIGEQTIATRPEWNEPARRNIVAAVSTNRKSRSRLSSRMLLSAAATVLCALGLILFQFVNSQSTESPAPADALKLDGHLVTDATGPSGLDVVLDRELTTRAGERAIVSIGSNTAGVGEKSTFKIVRATKAATRLHLVNGRIACDVTPTERRSPFVVTVASIEVRVLGTQFMVEISDGGPVKVIVKRGTVEVVGISGGPVRVHASKRLSIDSNGNHRLVQSSEADETKIARLLTEMGSSPDNRAAEQRAPVISPAPLPPSDPNPNRPDFKKTASKDRLKTWQQWVINGESQRALPELKRFLSQNPNHAQGWFLLADCQKRNADFGGALNSYTKVAELNGRVANTARYRAGVVLQDNIENHPRAVDQFRAFLNHAPRNHALRADAMLRLARSLRATGKAAAARQLLQRITVDHEATAAAIQAKRLLDSER